MIRKIELTKERKWLLGIGAVLLLMGLVYRFYPALSGLWPGDEEILVKAKQISKYRETVQNAGDLEGRLLALTRTVERFDSRLLNGDTPSLAAVDIQNILADITGRASVDIRTVRVLRPEDLEEQSYLRIPVQFLVTCSPRQLRDVLYGIESSPKLLVFERVRISAMGKEGEQVQGDIIVSGYMRKAAS
ncbi:MAG TPA: type II secretion system protein GspM [Syntrophales bacterium]|nr:type II secretion system protein GspM [Syntrophales bacterium]